MPIRLWACLTGSCTVIWFKNDTGICRRCGKPGVESYWNIR